MKIKLKLLAALTVFSVGSVFAQVGVGTTTPNSSSALDVASTTKGFLAPRHTTANRDAIVLPATGLIIFNTTTNQLQFNAGTPAAPIWIAASGASVTANNGLTATAGNIKLGGALTEITTIAQGANNLLFTSNVTNAFSVDGFTFSVDAANDRVGIGTANPQHKLDALTSNSGGGYGSAGAGFGTFRFGNTGFFGAPKILLTGFSGAALANISAYEASNTSTMLSFTAGTSENILNISSNSNVGIGTTTPTQKLDVNGAIKFSGALMPNNLSGTTGQILTSAGAGAAPTWVTPAVTATPTFRTIVNTTVMPILASDLGNIVLFEGGTSGDVQFPTPDASMIGKKLTLISTDGVIVVLTNLNPNYKTTTFGSMQRYGAEFITDGTNWYAVGGQ